MLLCFGVSFGFLLLSQCDLLLFGDLNLCICLSFHVFPNLLHYYLSNCGSALNKCCQLSRILRLL